ncbi:MAG: YdcH family protein [Pseudoxanthomonas sp.]
MEPSNPADIAQHVAELKLEHRRLDAEIERLAADVHADEVAVKRLKKRKLWLKDCIARLESALIPDEPA